MANPRIQNPWGAPAPAPASPAPQAPPPLKPGDPILGSAVEQASKPDDPFAPPYDPGWNSGALASNDLRGYGTFANDLKIPQAQPNTRGVLQDPGDMETAFAQHGQEFFQPGAATDFWNQYGSQFGQPSAAGQYFNSVSGKSAPTTQNRSDQAYEQYQREMPSILQAPDLGTYYDQAQARTLRGITNDQTSRGLYGSSAGAGVAGDAIANLQAQRANREADYNLARNADRRASLSGASDAARAGDITDLANGQLDLSWMSGMGNLASGADSSRLTGLATGMSAAGNASDERLRGLSGGMAAAGASQGAEQNREQGQLADLQRIYQMLTGTALGSYGSELSADDALMGGQFGAETAGKTNAYTMDQNAQQRPMTDLGAILDLYKSLQGPAQPAQPAQPGKG